MWMKGNGYADRQNQNQIIKFRYADALPDFPAGHFSAESAGHLAGGLVGDLPGGSGPRSVITNDCAPHATW